MEGARTVALFFLAGAGAICPQLTYGQDFPQKPIRIVAAEPGGGGDFVARLIAQSLTGSFGQQVIVENRGGAVSVRAEMVARAAPDGYTLQFIGSPLWLLPFMRENLSYNPVRDFAPVTLAVSTPNLLVVHPSVPANSLQELIGLARTRPGELNYGAGATGGSPHLSAELFKAMAAVNIVHIPYKGTGPALNALIGGQVHLLFAAPASVMPQVKAGRLRALAVTSLQPSALLPGLPTMADSGLPGYESVSPFGLFAPARTPVAIVNRLSQETVRVLRRADVKERLLNAGIEAVGSTPEEFASTIKSDMVRWGKLIKDAGIRED
jgi:tripartite-type tricarboxylate transporter receptor subunit TctC